MQLVKHLDKDVEKIGEYDPVGHDVNGYAIFALPDELAEDLLRFGHAFSRPDAEVAKEDASAVAAVQAKQEKERKQREEEAAAQREKDVEAARKRLKNLDEHAPYDGAGDDKALVAQWDAEQELAAKEEAEAKKKKSK